MLFFRFKSASNVLRAPSDSPCKNRSAHIVLEQSSWNSFPGLLCDSLCSAHACLPVVATGENTPRLDQGVCDCGSRVYGESSASPSQWSEVASESAVFLFNLDLRSRCIRARRPAAPRPRSLSLQSNGSRRGDKRNWLMLGMWSFIADTSLYGPFPAPAAGISTGRSDAVSSPGSTRWSSRISCMSGVRSQAGAKKTKPFRKLLELNLLHAFTRSGGEWRNCCPAWGGGRWAIGRRAFFGLSCHGVHRSHGRHRGPGKCHRNSQGVHRTRARWAALTHSFVDPGCWKGRKMRCKSGDMKTVYSWLHGRKTCSFEVASGRTKREKDCETFGSKWSRGNDKPSFRPQYSLKWNDLLLSSLLSISVGPRPLQSRAVRALLFWRSAMPLEARAAQLYTKLALRWEPVLRAVASVSLDNHLALSIKNRCALRQSLNPIEVLTELASVLDKFRSGCPLREKLGANPGTASTEAQCTQIFLSSGSGKGKFQRLGGLAFVQRILRNHHECLGTPTATHEKGVWKDLMTLLMEYRIRQQHLLHHCGHLRTSRRSPRSSQDSTTKSRARTSPTTASTTTCRSGLGPQ